MAQTQALLLNAEIAAVLSSMRQNAKWALIPKQYSQHDDEIGDDPLLEDFRQLRRSIFRWPDWSVIPPLEYLNPFLEVIRSPETSGPITGVALTSVRRILDQDIIGLSRTGVAEAMSATADSITQCKFEATDPASDEVVLYKILQVLSSCVRCAAGCHLSNRNVILIFEACFRIGHYQTERSKDMSELLTQASRQIMLELVATIFSRLGELAPLPPVTGVHTMAASRIQSPGLEDLGDLAAEATADAAGSGIGGSGGGGSTSEAKSGDATAGSSTPSATSAQQQHAGDNTTADECAVAASPGGHPVDVPSPASAAAGYDPGGAAASVPEGSGTKAAVHDWTGSHHTVSVAAPSPIRTHGEASEVSVPGTPGASMSGSFAESGDAATARHGMPCVVDILKFIVSYVNSVSEGVHTDLNEFGLELMNVALNAGGPAFERHPALMAILQEDLFVALSLAARAPNLACLSGSCQVVLTLYCHLGKHLLLQLEAFMSDILLKLAEGKGVVKIEQQEAALEGVLDFCNQASFIRNVYLNLDCRIERGNLFEDMAALLSKTAFPVNTPLGSVHLLSLEGLFSILSSLSDTCKGASGWSSPAEAVVAPVEVDELRAIWDALINGRVTPVPPSSSASADGAAGGNGAGRSLASLDCALAAGARREKAVKQRLIVAADHFNRDYRKGLQYLQSMGLMGQKLDAKEVALFLRTCPGLAKKTIGELLGEQSEFWLAVLEGFVHTFDFRGLDFDSSLRMLLQAFRLPGEAQKIHRIVESFAGHYFQQCSGVFKTQDAAFVLSYSIIMLNTDLHNKQVKHKMTSDEFKRNNRGINEGEDLPAAFLEQIYTSIQRNEIKLESAETVSTAVAVSPVIWTELQRMSYQPRGVMIDAPLTGCTRVERDMFVLVWGPTVAAVSVVLDHAEAADIVGTAVDGLLHAARIAAFHHVDDVMDNLVGSLSRYTQLLNPSDPSKAVVSFGESEKARKAVKAVFDVANRYGSSLRAGWRDILDCITRLHKLGLLPHHMLRAPGDAPEAAAARLPKPSAPVRSSSSGSLLSRAINSLISVDGSQEGSGGERSDREKEAWASTTATVHACDPAAIFGPTSVALPPDALAALMRATVFAAASSVHPDDGSDTAELCLELLFTLVANNASRAPLLWPTLHEALAGVMSPERATVAGDLVRRAVSGLLRVAGLLLGAGEEITGMVLRSLQLLPKLHANVAWELAEPLSAQTLDLVSVAGPRIHSAGGWRILCNLITTTSVHPGAFGTAFHALVEATSPQRLSLPAYQPCLGAVQTFIARQAKKDPYPSGSLKALDQLEVMFQWLATHAANTPSSSTAADAENMVPPSDQAAYQAGRAAASDTGPPPQEGDTKSHDEEVAAAGAAAVAAAAQEERTTSHPRLLPVQGGALGPAAGQQEAPLTVGDAWLQSLRLAALVCHEPNYHLRARAAVILVGMVTASDGMGLPGELWLRGLGDVLLPLVADLNSLLAARPRDFVDVGKTLVAAMGALSKGLLLSLPLTAPLSAFPELWMRILRVLQECISSRSDELAEHVPEALKNMLNVMSAGGVLVPTWRDAAGNSMWDATWARAREVSSGLGPQMLEQVEPRVPLPPQPPPPPQQQQQHQQPVPQQQPVLQQSPPQMGAQPAGVPPAGSMPPSTSLGAPPYGAGVPPSAGPGGGLAPPFQQQQQQQWAPQVPPHMAPASPGPYGHGPVDASAFPLSPPQVPPPGGGSAALHAAIAAAQAVMHEDASDDEETSPVGAPDRGQVAASDSIAAARTSDMAAAAAAADLPAPLPLALQRPPAEEQAPLAVPGAAGAGGPAGLVAPDGVGANLRTDDAAAAAASASVAAAVASDLGPAAEGVSPSLPRDNAPTAASQPGQPLSAPAALRGPLPGGTVGGNGDQHSAAPLAASGTSLTAADEAGVSEQALQPQQPAHDQQRDLRDEDSTEAEQEEQSGGACKQS
mmetsp:Transcript_17390/g.52068  ORF Transcript_17390/g.52068 Transcript_17390/m.52068 type:complete len:1953 (-) Transcript_17390:228-6086(-)|eukprot:CAMPEP_0206137616 /NCGR_PEP_ID=MMETSP1473-20131121/2710_1 /ASSEMBLY_ACC=CAM_ASM_001109 /TAXON_ID=1461547 /ORGANISM="Stichococcus sp, Strain RCC1054" /LENGTH=1952 /DNA_ID=CAMNT_0053530793 /DNA_START=161 /DNA_END=6019 /DNA_ORIENTATION=+